MANETQQKPHLLGGRRMFNYPVEVKYVCMGAEIFKGFLSSQP